MTIYDLAEALKRYKKAIAISFGVLLLLVLVMTFTISDGKPTFRAALKYDSSVQIAVVAPGSDSLISTVGGSENLVSAANLYASLLGSDEAAQWIGEQNGYKLESAVDATTERNSTVIIVQVTGPTPEQAKGAALSTFDWLNKKLQEPVQTADFPSPPTTVPVIILDGPFTSNIDVELDASLASTGRDLFLFIDLGGISPIALPLQQAAGSTVRTRTTLEPLTTVVLTLTNASDEVLDTIRLAPDPIPRVVSAVPELSLVLGADSIRSVAVEEGEGETTWKFSGSGVVLEWTEGVSNVAIPVVVTVDVDLALLTPEPGFLATGGRRGPIVAVAALIVGSILILTAVIVADTWRVERDARSLSCFELTSSQIPGQSNETGPQTGVDETLVADIEVRPASLEL